MDLKTVDHLLTTTRSVRKRLDLERPVPPELIEECIELAIQAPTGSNSQNWHFLVVTDADKKREIASYYKPPLKEYLDMLEGAEPRYPEADPRRAQEARVYDSAWYLAEHLHEVPVHLIGCVEGRVESAGPLAQASLYGSILPAVWSLMLALRSRGLGSAWTTLHLSAEAQIAKLLGMPENITQAALLPVAYFTGEEFKPARRIPGREVTSWNTWGARR